MHLEILPLLRCPACSGTKLSCEQFCGDGRQIITQGVVWCCGCKTWYPIEDGLLELLTGDLMYHDDKVKFARKYSNDLAQLGLDPTCTVVEKRKNFLQLLQQSHFDWYAGNTDQTYSDYEKTSFWLAADRLAFDGWRHEIQKGTWLLDIGCAQGRSTFKFMDMDIKIIGIDISKNLLHQAISRYKNGKSEAQATFIAADASELPIVSNKIDYVLIYGVLHHLPDPRKMCQEVGRVLKNDGIYFGSENNVTIFRKLFDLLQKIMPIWSEKAGPEALISKKFLTDAFRETGVQLTTSTSIFLPPHLMNLLSLSAAYYLLKLTDRISRFIPGLKDNGGLILIHGKKSGEPARA